VTLAYLKTFRAVAAAKSFRRAAASLHLTQPAVTRQIQALEREIGGRLFDRGRPIALTPAGEVLLRYASEVGDLVQSAAREIDELRSPDGGHLTLAASFSVADRLPALVRRLRARHPTMTISIETRWPDEVMHRVVERDADLGLLVLTDVLEPHCPSALRAVPLETGPMAFIAPRVPTWVTRRRVRLDDVAAFPWVMNHPSCVYHQYVQRLFAASGRAVTVAIDGVGIEEQCRLVSLGLGLGFVPRAFVARASWTRRLRMFAIDGTDPRTIIGTVYRRDKRLHAPARALLGLLREDFPSAPWPAAV
jgi:DNA-binding transcriptional LysR family regulator